MAKRGRPKKIKEVGMYPPQVPSVACEPTIIGDCGETQTPKEEIKVNPQLKETVRDLTKTFGHEIIHFASEEPEREKIPLPVEIMNKFLGGGLQCGSFSVLWGNKSVSKTTIALNCIAAAQKVGKQCIYFDVENSFDKPWAEKQGVDLNRLLIAHTETAEEALDVLMKMSREKVIDFAVIDSVQALTPHDENYEGKAEKERSTADSSMALLARKLSQFFRMAGAGVYRGKVAVLLIGQARTDLGAFIKLDKLSGGHALAHYASIIVRAYRGAKSDAPQYQFKVGDKKKSLPIGFPLHLRLEKTKVSGTAPESSDIQMPFYYETCFVRPSDEQIQKIFGEWIEWESEE